MSKQNESAELEAFFAAFADKTRLRLINLLRGGKVSVCFLADALGESQPKISRHLACLRNAGILEARRDGKWIYYKIVEPENVFAARVLQAVLSWLDSQAVMRAEFRKISERLDAPDEFILEVAEEEKFVSDSANMRRNQGRELETFLL